MTATVGFSFSAGSAAKRLVLFALNTTILLLGLTCSILSWYQLKLMPQTYDVITSSIQQADLSEFLVKKVGPPREALVLESPFTSHVPAIILTTSKVITNPSKPIATKVTTAKRSITKTTTSTTHTSVSTKRAVTTTFIPTVFTPIRTNPTPTKLLTAKLTTTKPITTKPTTTKPTTTKPATSKPATSKPATSKPATTKPTTTKPATTKPATTKPATTKPTTKTPQATPFPVHSALSPLSFSESLSEREGLPEELLPELSLGHDNIKPKPDLTFSNEDFSKTAFQSVKEANDPTIMSSSASENTEVKRGIDTTLSVSFKHSVGTLPSNGIKESLTNSVDKSNSRTESTLGPTRKTNPVTTHVKPIESVAESENYNSVPDWHDPLDSAIKFISNSTKKKRDAVSLSKLTPPFNGKITNNNIPPYFEDVFYIVQDSLYVGSAAGVLIFFSSLVGICGGIFRVNGCLKFSIAALVIVILGEMATVGFIFLAHDKATNRNKNKNFEENLELLCKIAHFCINPMMLVIVGSFLCVSIVLQFGSVTLSCTLLKHSSENENDYVGAGWRRGGKGRSRTDFQLASFGMHPLANPMPMQMPYFNGSSMPFSYTSMMPMQGYFNQPMYAGPGQRPPHF